MKDNIELIYVYDPLCGWCYGFHPVMEKLAKRFEGELKIRVIPGGLAIGENVQTIGDGYNYIPKASKQVENVTGASFGQNFYLLAEEGSYLYNSEPSCIAQTTINRIAPELGLKFAGMMQNAFFEHGKSLNEWETFKEIFTDLDIEAEDAKSVFNDPNTKSETYEQFEWCKAHDADAFPALVLQIGDETGLMSRGYRPFDTLESHLHHLLNNLHKVTS